MAEAFGLDYFRRLWKSAVWLRMVEASTKTVSFGATIFLVEKKKTFKAQTGL